MSAILYGEREYPLLTVFERLQRTFDASPSGDFRILLWTHERYYVTQSSQYGKREVELGYHKDEEDFLNQVQTKGSRWRTERATSVEQLRNYLQKQKFDAVVILGGTPISLAQSAVYYFEEVSNGPKALSIEFNNWTGHDAYSVWSTLDRYGHVHLLKCFAHLTERKKNTKYLPTALKPDRSVPIWDLQEHDIEPVHIKHLFDRRIEESTRLDYKRASAINLKADISDVLKDICAFANTEGGTIIFGVVEKDGSPVLPMSAGLESVLQPDRAINRIMSSLADTSRPVIPKLDFRTLVIDGKTVVVAQISEAVDKRCGERAFHDGRKLPVRRNRITGWVKPAQPIDASTTGD